MDNIGKEDVFEYMIKNEMNRITIDDWGGGSSKIFSISAMLPRFTGITKEIYKTYEFLISYKSGGGAGMGAYPATIKIYILHRF